MKYLLITFLILGGTSILTSHREPLHTATTENQFEVPKFLEPSIDWLAKAQFENGGWGAGLHSRQGIHDPHAVDIDPATTAFAAMALMRSGHTLNEGKYSTNVQKAYTLILTMIEESPEIHFWEQLWQCIFYRSLSSIGRITRCTPTVNCQSPKSHTNTTSPQPEIAYQNKLSHH